MATLDDVLKPYYWRRRLDINKPEECEEFVEYVVQQALISIKDPDQAEQVVTEVMQKIERGHINARNRIRHIL